ncbi:hypothetical protein D1BOALGB6SA_9984 [Olavius sp. associated proteobacterium Delta 1]|nr:hypothetical protein D1BOALGB6SA_9984 [Olavius sp. associated proteobacterium Delta 1]
MCIIAFIEDQHIVKKILQHLDLWHVKRKPPPRANGPPADTIIIYDESSWPSADDYLIDADCTTLRLSTGYQFVTYLQKNPASSKSAGGGPKLSYNSTPVQKIDIDNKAHLR